MAIREGFPVIRLTMPNEVRPIHLQLLAQKVTAGQWPPPYVGDRIYTVRPMRTIDELMAELAAGRTDDFRMLEWLSMIGRKAAWDARHEGRVEETADLIWDATTRSATLRRALYRKLCQHKLQKRVAIAPSLVHAFERFRRRATDGDQILACRFIQALSPSNTAAGAIASLALEENVTPERLRARTQMPTRLEPVLAALDQAPLTWLCQRKKHQHGEQWLVECLQELGEHAEIAAVESLLEALPKEEAGQYRQFVGWLKSRYSVQGEGLMRLSRLSRKAQHTLRDWIGAVNFALFERLVEQLLNSEWKNLLADPVRDSNQMRSRSVFWSNYSHRFSRIRILLTRNAASVLDLRNLDTHEIGYMKEDDIRYTDSTQPSEVCIFDFDHWLVAEFFRGRGSETLVLPATERLRKELFEGTELSVKRIRALGTLELEQRLVLDHVFLWQYHSERALAARGIFPNDDLDSFKGLGRGRPQRYRYHRDHGMPMPSEADAAQRAQGYEGWRRTVNRLLIEARDTYRSL